MENESLDYYRARARNEREAAAGASCDEARHAHEVMADAYARLVELAELQDRGEVPPGKVTSLAETLHQRERTEYGGHAPKHG